MNLKRLIVLTNMPSPYQVDFFNALGKELDLKVVYVKKTESNRKWNYEQHIKHNHIFLDNPYKRKFAEINKILRKDALFIVSGYNLPALIYSMTNLTARGIPWVFWGEKIRLSKLWIKKPTIFRLLKHAKAILGIGKVAARIYYEISEIPTFVFPYHTDTSRFKRNSYFQNGKINFLYSGQLIERKGIPDIMEAFGIVSKEYGDKAHLHIIGDGPLLEFIRQETVIYNSRVHLYGFKRYNVLPEIYQNGDVFLFPSLYDGWGVALAEGMAAGMVPISTFTTGAATDLILNGHNGFIIPPSQPITLAHYMKELIKNPEKLQQMGKRAAEYVHMENNIHKGVYRLMKILSQI